jgi:hypothetical protein
MRLPIHLALEKRGLESTDLAAAKMAAESLCELVGLVYWRLVWIHPFADGNGRTAHLAALIIAMRTIAGHGGGGEGRRDGEEEKKKKEKRGRREGGGEGRGGGSASTSRMCTGDAWFASLSAVSFPSVTSLGTISRPATKMSAFIDCIKFLEFRRLEVRKQLVAALRDADAVWAKKSADEREKALGSGTPGEATVRSSPWTEVGRVLLREAWFAVGSSLHSLTTQKVTKEKMYRWKNDLGGGDYSTGITASAGDLDDTEDVRPTWIETCGPRTWRDLDERMLRP